MPLHYPRPSPQEEIDLINKTRFNQAVIRGIHYNRISTLQAQKLMRDMQNPKSSNLMMDKDGRTYVKEQTLMNLMLD